MGLDSAALEQVRAVWRGRLGAPGAFRAPGVHLHVRDGADRWVAVVTLADATCLSVSAAAARTLTPEVAAGAAASPPPAGAAPLGGLPGPVAEVIGPAVLLYLDPARLDPGRVPARPQAAVSAADLAAAAELAAACPPGDRDESGILQITSAPWVWRERGPGGGLVVAAACGYQVWDGRLAHLAVLVHPDRRGKGLGRAVAAAAVRAAAAEGLIPQWRAHTGNLASLRIARALGFTEAGWQAAYRVQRQPGR